MNEQVIPGKLTPKDFASDQEVRWCPGCGDYAILKCLQRTLPEIGTPPEKIVFVSGIGCSSRFPYYMATYGFHTIHGRAPAVATGLKLANPSLDVWVVTGDGDGLSIGGNHLLHVLRRNVDVNILLFNNEIYGLTKGQYSPTSHPGTRSPSTPFGSVEPAVSPCAFALGAGARFIARAVDTDQKQMPEVFKRAHAHRGASFVEIFQNCIVYNDAVFEDFTAREVADERQIFVRHGAPLVFGADNKKGIRLDPQKLCLEVITLGENGRTLSDVLVHDETNPVLAQMLIRLSPPAFPMALGVLYCNPVPSFEASMQKQIAEVTAAKKGASLEALMRAGRTWEVR
ncbi:MAG TPA: 2-oxoacid:ferredoxin oxidoreductase subunit beta [Sphingomonadales bacterium]|nr:2-oxoacid:ferredoxin oxidoreductase subunit beta [Sphingomonadales bacterium]